MTPCNSNSEREEYGHDHPGDLEVQLRRRVVRVTTLVFGTALGAYGGDNQNQERSPRKYQWKEVYGVV